MSIDIDSILINSDFAKNTDEELTEIASTGEVISEALIDGIDAIGTLSFWAADNKTTDAVEMRKALQGIGYFLSIAVPLMNSVNSISDSAYGKLRNKWSTSNEPQQN